MEVVRHVSCVKHSVKTSISGKVMRDKIGKLVLQPAVEGMWGQWCLGCHAVDAQ